MNDSDTNYYNDGDYQGGERGYTGGEFANLFSQFDSAIKPGKVVTGSVVALSKDMATVDIGHKSDGVIPLEQFQDSEGNVKVNVGDKVELYVVLLENESGQIVLSKEKADQKRVWELVEDTFKTGGIITGRVVQKVKGGLQVDIGIPAFLPGSQIDTRPHRNLDKFINQVFRFKVLKITREKGNIVLSRRSVLEAEREALRSETLKVLQEGVVMEGTVKNITDYGAFIDLGGIDGLLHITDMSWGRMKHPSEKLAVGDSVPVVVLKYDNDRERVSLGMKQLTENPWLSVNNRYPVGTKVTGKVVNIIDYGAFIELEDGVEGLIHISEMSWTKKVRHPSKLLNEGDLVEAVVLEIQSESGEPKISLGLKQLLENPWDHLRQKHPIGSKVSGKVRSITDFGVFVGIDDGIDGLVHVTDFSWTKRIKDPKEIHQWFKKGDEVEAVVLDIDADNERLSLGIKQLEADPWDTISQRYPLNAKVKGVIRSITEFGIFVEIEEGIEGLIHSSQLGLDRDANIREFYQEGKEIESEVTNIDTNERRISLSIKAIKRRQEKDQFAEFMEDNNGGAVTFGDLLRQKIDTSSTRE
jgi:small subunit ribosomal protein S1